MTEITPPRDPSDMTLDQVVATVYDSLKAESRYSSQSLHRAMTDIELFVRYLDFREITRLTNVTPEVALSFIDEALHDGKQWKDPAIGTRHYRRTAIRTLFFSARQLGIASHEPTLDRVLDPRTTVSVRPLTDAEEEECREQSQRTMRDKRLPAAWALGQATATSAELAVVTVKDVDFDRRRVWLSGTIRRQARWGDLTDWGFVAIERRANQLGDESKRLITRNSTGSVSGQAASCGAIHDVLERAGLGGIEGVRPTSLPAWRGVRVFTSTGRIEDVARVLGLNSLDGAAAAIGWGWKK